MAISEISRIESALPQESEYKSVAPKARRYESQGQALSKAKSVAPGRLGEEWRALKVRDK
jgi:hypothetical protein